MKLKNLLIVSGTGSKSGKTTMVCRLISQFRDFKPVAIKISPHYHEKSSGLSDVFSGEGYAVYKETDASTGKDTSKMLKAGASAVYLILAWEAPLQDVFMKLMELIPGSRPVICESPSLRNHIEPGLFIIMNSEKVVPREDLVHLQEFPHLKYNLEKSLDTMKLKFSDGIWIELPGIFQP